MNLAPLTPDLARQQLPHALAHSEFSNLGTIYSGKVRDVYRTKDRLVLVTTDRVSAFDHVLGTIPWKGQILNAIAVDAFRRTEDILPNHLLDVPDPNVMVAVALAAHPVEFVVREYITGSLWRDYEAKKAHYVELPPGLKRDQKLPMGPILTPSTKAELGQHDEPISKKDLVLRGYISEVALAEAEEAGLALFERGKELARSRGLILVDTKYELGRDERGRLTLMDELHTPDSSRYWVEESYAARVAAGESPEMLDKENLRRWLIETKGFSGHGTPPALDDQIRVDLAGFYACSGAPRKSSLALPGRASRARSELLATSPPEEKSRARGARPLHGRPTSRRCCRHAPPPPRQTEPR